MRATVLRSQVDKETIRSLFRMMGSDHSRGRQGILLMREWKGKLKGGNVLGEVITEGGITGEGMTGESSAGITGEVMTEGGITGEGMTGESSAGITGEVMTEGGITGCMMTGESSTGITGEGMTGEAIRVVNAAEADEDGEWVKRWRDR